VDYVHVVGCGVLIYDYILTIGFEITLIWPSPWNYTKVLFILARYIPLINVYFLLHDQVLLGNTANGCSWSFHLATWMVTVGIYLAEVILAIRTWAVWRKNRRVGVVLAALLTAAIITECISVRTFLDTLEFGPAPYPEFRGCFVVSGSNLLFIGFIAIGSVEIVVLALMSISAFRAYRSGNNNHLSNVIHRDGILFYIYLLFANMVVMLVLPRDLQTLLAPLQGTFYSVFASRIILNIRTASQRGAEESMSELHHGYSEAHRMSLPLVFRLEAQLGDSGGVA